MNRIGFNIPIKIIAAVLLIYSLYTLEVQPHPTPQYNVLLITVDCLRPDHMGLYGYPRPTTPVIDAFFADAFRFEAYAQASWTSPGVVSLLTGLYPSVHGMDLKGKQTSSRADAPLKRLKQSGFTTWTYTADDNYGNLGWDQTVPRGELIETLGRLKGRRFFLWYHFRGPHLPYTAPEPYATEFMPVPGTLSDEARRAVTRGEMLPRGSARLVAADAPGIRALYDAEVRFQDENLQPLFGFLESSGLAEQTIVVLTADHAEELMEHGWVGHASTSLHATVFEEVVRIPLLIRIPGRIAGAHAPTVTAQQVDLMPTLFDLLGLDEPAGFQGVSLLPWIQGEGPALDRPLWIETSPCGWQCPESRYRERLAALRWGPWKLIEARPGGRRTYSLYNLRQDPEERRDLAGREPEMLKGLQKKLARVQKENLRQAYRRAFTTARRHLDAAEQAVAQGYFEKARVELQAVWALDRNYKNENPAFFEDGDFEQRTGWRRVLDRAEVLGRGVPNPATAPGSNK